MSLGPFDLAGGPFLALYIFLLAAASLAALLIPFRLRPSGRYKRLADVDEIAFLAGGIGRFSEAVVARLLAAGAMIMPDAKGFRAVPGAHADSSTERKVLALPAPIRWDEIEQLLKPHREPLERRLVAAGLLMSRNEAARIRFRAVLPYLLLIAFGATKWIIGEMRDRPTGFLTLLLILTAILALVRWLILDRRTQAGLDALARASDQRGRLGIAPTASETGLAVALVGTTVLDGSAWSSFHRLRHSNDGGSGDGGSGGGDGGGDGGGGCGGGCGGCGG